jgi:hypothetical protein
MAHLHKPLVIACKHKSTPVMRFCCTQQAVVFGHPQQCQGFRLVSHTCTSVLQAWGFDDERLSCLFGIIKVVHTASVAQQLTIERSFAIFRDTLINHSIQR